MSACETELFSHTHNRSHRDTDGDSELIFSFFLCDIFQEISFRTTNIWRYIINPDQDVCVPCESCSLRLLNKHQLVVFPFQTAEQDVMSQKMSGSKYINSYRFIDFNL